MHGKLNIKNGKYPMIYHQPFLFFFALDGHEYFPSRTLSFNPVKDNQTAGCMVPPTAHPMGPASPRGLWEPYLCH